MNRQSSVRADSVVSVKGQTVIPKEIREAAGIKEGTKVSWLLKDGALRLIVIPDDPVRAMRGILKGSGTYSEWLAERNEERRRELEKDEKEERRWRAMSSTRQQ